MNKPEVTFRSASAEDFVGVLSLLQQLWPNSQLDPAPLQRSFAALLASAGHFAFCAVSSGGTVGFATLFVRESLWQQARLGYIGELVVDAAFRSQGVGGALVHHLAEFAAAQGCSRLELDSAPHRTDAHRFYEHCGFERRSVLFSLPLVTVHRSDAGGATAQGLVHALCTELSERYGTVPTPFSPLDAFAPRTAFLVACLGTEPVGCGALRRLDDTTAEIKRMYVAPSGRRRGIARRILHELERAAEEFGYQAIRLETGNRQPEAIGLYETSGYRRIAAFGAYIGNPVSVCYEKTLNANERNAQPEREAV
jgi:GNAT superfamily N-acetyltransferase